MKYFKKFLAILLAISLLSCCCIVISSCANSFLSDAKFEFKLNADGKSYAVTDLKMHRGDIVEIPAKYKGKPVTAIADHAFSVSGSSSVKGYVLPDTIETIGERAFDNNYQLESVVLGNGVKTIGANAFDNCNSLLEIVLPDSLETIEKNAFYRCYSLKSINIPQNVKIIAPGAFEYCAGITELTVDDENQTFHDESNCVIETATKTLVLGCKASSIPQDYSSVTRIAERAFSRMGLNQIIIPENIVEMGSSEHGAFI